MKQDQRKEFRLSQETARRLEALAKIETGGNSSAWIKKKIDESWKKVK